MRQEEPGSGESSVDADGGEGEPAGPDAVELAAPEVVVPAREEPRGVPLADGLALTVDEANTLAASNGATLVMPLGPVGVGKTTLAVQIYARFLAQTVWADSSFCWSDTLLDYELLAFPSRLQSGADLPSTWRTRLRNDDGHLLHLRLRRTESPNTRSDLLFANLSGELSERVRDGHDPDTELPLLARSNRVLICVDGAKVAVPALSGRAVSGTRQMLRTLAERANLAPGAEVALVLTKWDKVVAAGAEQRWTDAELEIRDNVDALGRGVETFRVAARPDDAQPIDDGMEDLGRWLLSDDKQPSIAEAQVSAPNRAMGRLGETQA